MYNLLALTLALSALSAAAPTVPAPPTDTTVGNLDITIAGNPPLFENTANHPNKVECGPTGPHYVNVDDHPDPTRAFWGFNGAIELFCNTMATGLNGNPFTLAPHTSASTVISSNNKAGDKNIFITSNGYDAAYEGQIYCKFS
jgi:hypothetical protein